MWWGALGVLGDWAEGIPCGAPSCRIVQFYLSQLSQWTWQAPLLIFCEQPDEYGVKKCSMKKCKVDFIRLRWSFCVWNKCTPLKTRGILAIFIVRDSWHRRETICFFKLVIHRLYSDAGAWAAALAIIPHSSATWWEGAVNTKWAFAAKRAASDPKFKAKRQC